MQHKQRVAVGNGNSSGGILDVNGGNGVTNKGLDKAMTEASEDQGG